MISQHTVKGPEHIGKRVIAEQKLDDQRNTFDKSIKSDHQLPQHRNLFQNTDSKKHSQQNREE